MTEQTAAREPFAFQPSEGQELSVEEAVFQALGAASMCWDTTPTGIFDSTRAKEIGDALMAELRPHLKSVLDGTDRVTIYEDSVGQWRWRRQAAGNHERIAASGEAFSSRGAAFDAAQRANPGMPVWL